MRNRKKMCRSLVLLCLAMILLSGCAKQNRLDYPTGTKVPEAFLQKEEEKEPVEVKAKGYEYDEDALTYELVWSDEFDYEGLPDESKWGYDVGGSGWGNQELQYYTSDSNAWVKDGLLTIECRKEEKEGKDYTSARLVTRGKGDWLYGRIEVRAKLPQGLGTWPAIWMLPTDWEYGGWPASGEIDIMEHVGYDQDVVHASVHTQSYYHSIGTQKTSTIRVDGVSEEFHVYALEWLPDKIRMYVDEELYFTFQPTDYKKDPTWEEWPFDKKMHLLLNIAFGGGWGGARGIDDTCLPQQMLVDYVRVYQSPQLAGMQQGDKVLIEGPEYEMDDRFLKTDGTLVRDQSGTGEEVLLQGVNLGGWLLQEGWMCPLGVKDEKTLRATLTDRFGEEGMRELIDAYQEAWITEADLDVIAETGYNFVRVPM